MQLELGQGNERQKNAMDIWLFKAFHTLLTSERFVRRRSVKEVFLKILQNRQTPVPESPF